MTFVKGIAGAAALGAMMLIGCGLYAPAARAAYIVTLAQQGSNVVATGSGTIDLTDLAFIATFETNLSQLTPNIGFILTGPTSNVDYYSGVTGPTSFGSGANAVADSGSGDLVGIIGIENELGVPEGYVSGNALSDTSTYDNFTFSSLGVTPGTYEWTWGSGAHADSFTLDIPSTAVPEPSSGLLVGVALAVLLLVQTSRRIQNSR